MFTDGRNIRTNTTEGHGSGDSAETAGNLHHAQVAFGQVVVKRDAPVRPQAQDFGLALWQAQEQVAGFALLAAPALPGDGLGGGVVCQSSLCVKRA